MSVALLCLALGCAPPVAEGPPATTAYRLGGHWYYAANPHQALRYPCTGPANLPVLLEVEGRVTPGATLTLTAPDGRTVEGEVAEVVGAERRVPASLVAAQEQVESALGIVEPPHDTSWFDRFEEKHVDFDVVVDGIAFRWRGDPEVPANEVPMEALIAPASPAEQQRMHARLVHWATHPDLDPVNRVSALSYGGALGRTLGLDDRWLDDVPLTDGLVEACVAHERAQR